MLYEVITITTIALPEPNLLSIFSLKYLEYIFLFYSKIILFVKIFTIGYAYV